MGPEIEGVEMGVVPLTIIPGNPGAKSLLLFLELYHLLAKPSWFPREECFHQETITIALNRNRRLTPGHFGFHNSLNLQPKERSYFASWGD